MIGKYIIAGSKIWIGLEGGTQKTEPAGVTAVAAPDGLQGKLEYESTFGP